MAGAFTESTVIGTAGDTIDRLDIPEAEKTRLKNNIPVAYAVTYLVGTGLVVWFLSSGAPRLLRINLKEESRKLAAQLVEATRQTTPCRWRTRNGAFARSGSPRARWAGPSRISNAWSPAPSGSSSNASGGVLSSSRPLRTPFCNRTMSWRSGRGGECCSAGTCRCGQEVEDPELLAFPMATLDVVVTKRSAVEQPLTGSGPATRTRCRPRETDPRRRGDSLHARDDRQPGRHSPARRRPAGRGARRSGVGLHRTSVQRIRRRVPGAGYRHRRSRRAADVHRRGASADADHQRRCADHGPRLRLAAFGVSDVRQNPRAGPLDLRHRRPCGLHRRGGIDRRPDIRLRASPDRPEPAAGRDDRGAPAAPPDPALRASCPEDEPA